MNVRKLNQCMEILKEDMGDGLLEAHIVSVDDAQTLVETEGASEKTAATFVEITESCVALLKQVPYPTNGRFALMDLANNQTLVFIFLGKYNWNIVLDSRKVKLGLFLNIILPKIISAFEDAVVS